MRPYTRRRVGGGRRPQSHTIPVPCIGRVRQGRRARGVTRYRAGRVHHPTGSPEQRVPPGPRSSICSRDTSARRLTLPQPRSSGRSCGQRSSGRGARACCPPRRAESVIQRAVRQRQGCLMPLSGGQGRTRPLGCLTGRGLMQYARSHSCRSSTFSRPSYLAPSRLFASVPPCSVSKSVATPPARCAPGA